MARNVKRYGGEMRGVEKREEWEETKSRKIRGRRRGMRRGITESRRRGEKIVEKGMDGKEEGGRDWKEKKRDKRGTWSGRARSLG